MYKKIINDLAEALVKKRMHELRHAQEIRYMYEVKMKRLNKMMKTMFSFLEEIRIQEEVFKKNIFLTNFIIDFK